ncbi:acetoin dehydrogenase dihydrolipoyllysine-residue acetyltransferase subunit [Oceaniglobus ichthyenteri]|uniref:acetoin dehydrogenase dihydrolipoyllysine-residue acetyltransferase subunit n=1 Tax=Oceaniglobus ichthyenteri TaxID=2136177 RepID=UPI000D3921D0|nr:acetoin dehydrogenase dihydrolipoyllysine-residue acetyltransferase subunit [Oceaniglobus ichthyenteri]
MPVVVIMPKVDMDMSHGTVSAWHVAAGGAVTKGDPLFDIETDKAAMEVESPGTGTLHHIIANIGDTVAIGEPIAWIYAEGEAVGDAPQGPAKAAEAPAPADKDEPPTPAPTPDQISDSAQNGETGLRATPLARRLARERQLNLSDLRGTGPRGRIQAQDVPKKAATPAHPTSKGHTTGQTPILLIHGFASDPASWARLERELGQRHIIRMELPAHGRLTGDVPDSFADLARRMRDAFDDLGQENVHLVGHSLGAAAALAIADVRPRQIASLTLISPAGLGPEINGAAITGVAGAPRVESLGPWLRTLAHDPDLITDAYVRAIMAQRQNPAVRQAQLALADAVFPDGVQAFDLRAALDRVDMPTRIIWGRNDRIIPWKHALSAPGRVSLNLFERTGHMPHIEKPAEIAFLLRQRGE